MQENVACAKSPQRRARRSSVGAGSIDEWTEPGAAKMSIVGEPGSTLQWERTGTRVFRTLFNEFGGSAIGSAADSGSAICRFKSCCPPRQKRSAQRCKPLAHRPKGRAHPWSGKRIVRAPRKAKADLAQLEEYASTLPIKKARWQVSATPLFFRLLPLWTQGNGSGGVFGLCRRLGGGGAFHITTGDGSLPLYRMMPWLPNGEGGCQQRK